MTVFVSPRANIYTSMHPPFTFGLFLMDMTANMPPEVEQARQLHRTLTEKGLDKAFSDLQWKQLLIENPEVAMQEANFPEAYQLLEGSDEVEVRGHIGCIYE